MFSLDQKPFEPVAFHLQLGQPFGLLGLHAALQLPPAVVGRLNDLKRTADINDGLALSKQLVSSLALEDDLLRCVANSLNSGVPILVWPDEDSHSTWTGFQEPRLSLRLQRQQERDVYDKYAPPSNRRSRAQQKHCPRGCGVGLTGLRFKALWKKR